MSLTNPTDRKIKIIIKRPDEKVGHSTWISPKLENLQKTVDGFIEYVELDEDLVLIVNEEGRFTQDYNCTIMGLDIYGTFIMAGRDPENTDHGLKDIPIDFKTYKRWFE